MQNPLSQTYKSIAHQELNHLLVAINTAETEAKQYLQALELSRTMINRRLQELAEAPTETSADQSSLISETPSSAPQQTQVLIHDPG